MNLTRRSWFGSIIASLVGLVVAVKHRHGAIASMTKPTPSSFYDNYPRHCTFVYDSTQPLNTIIGDGRSRLSLTTATADSPAFAALRVPNPGPLLASAPRSV